MDQLKKALQNAGFFASEQVKVKERTRTAVKLDKEREGHEIRNQCEFCDGFTQDVEYYDHPNKYVAKKWLCVKCADEHRISDDFRRTTQSSSARSNRFQRNYGHTKKFAQGK